MKKLSLYLFFLISCLFFNQTFICTSISEPTTIQELYETALNYKKAENYKKALILLKSAHVLSPENELILQELSEIELKQFHIKRGFLLRHEAIKKKFLYEPAWNGEPLRKKKIMVHVMDNTPTEEVLIHTRFLTKLKKMGATVLISGKRSLQDLFESISAIDMFIPVAQVPVTDGYGCQLQSREITETVDYHVNLLSLPAILKQGNKIESLEEDFFTDSFSNKKPQNNQFTIAIYLEDTLAQLDWSLLTTIPSTTISLFTPHENDELWQTREASFDEIIKTCDVLISCDSSLAHYAAIHKMPVCLIVNSNSAWYHPSTMSKSPWYSSMHLIFNDPDMPKTMLVEAIKTCIKENFYKSEYEK